MSTTEQKLQKIKDIILQKANIKADELVFKAMAQKNEMIEEKEIEVLKKKYKEINKKTLEIRRETTQRISNFDIKNKRKLLLKKNDFCNQIFENVFVKLCNFVKTEKYKELFEQKLERNLKNSFEQFSDLSSLNFYVKHGDEAIMECLDKVFGKTISVLQEDEIKIGGVKVVDSNNGLCWDETLDTKLVEQKNWFYANSQELSY